MLVRISKIVNWVCKSRQGQSRPTVQVRLGWERSICLFAGGLLGKNTEVPGIKKQSYEEWLAERSRPGYIAEIPRTPAANAHKPEQPQNSVSAKPKPSTAQEALPNGTSSARNSDGQTFEEWLAERATSAPTHVIGVSEGGDLEAYGEDPSHNGDGNVRTKAQMTQAPEVNGYSHAPSERSTEATKRSGVRHFPAVNGADYLVSGSQTAVVAGHSAISHSDQDAMLQSMLFEDSLLGQTSPPQNVFLPSRKPPSTSSREQAHAPASQWAEGGSRHGGSPAGGPMPDTPALRHQQLLEAAIKKMQQEHDEQVLQS